MITAILAAMLVFHPGDRVPQWIEQDYKSRPTDTPARLYFTGTWIGHRLKNKCWVFAPEGRVPNEVMRSDEPGDHSIRGVNCSMFVTSYWAFFVGNSPDGGWRK